LRLYLISEDILATLSDPDLDDAARSEILDQMFAGFHEKCEAIAGQLKNWSAEEKALDEEMKALKARRDSTRSKMTRLKEYALAEMKRVELGKAGGKVNKLQIDKKVASLLIPDETAVPEEYARRETVIKVDRKAIRAYLEDEDSEKVNWASLGVDTQTIKVK